MGYASLASPVCVVAFSFLLLSRLALHSAEDESLICLPFLCGNFNISHPFNNATHRECGLSTIRCENTKPMIVSDAGIRYQVKSVDKNSKTILIHDEQLHEKLAEGNCHDLFNFQTPIFPSLSFKVKSNYTWFKCDLPPPPEQLAGFQEYPHCKHPKIFYENNPEPSLANAPITPPNCSVFYFPVLPPKDGDSWAFEFSLEWSYPSQCHDCEAKCRRDSDGTVIKCARTKHGNKLTVGQTLGIVFGAVGGSLILALILCRRIYSLPLFGLAKTKNISPSLTSPTSYPPPKMDVEKGGSTYMGVPIFSYDELVEATNSFDSNRALGDGGFGTVYYGKLRDGCEVAAKRLYENTFKRVEQFMNEVEILTRLRHQNLVTLHGCTSRHSHELILVYEYIPNGTVADHLHGDRARTSPLTWPIRMSIAIETASALSYLHATDIIHRDVKSNNILLDNNFRVKVADFGLSRLFPPDVTHVSTAPQGTPGYVDPEYHQCYQLTGKSDVYSFGVVLIELISSKPAVDTNRPRQEINLANMALKKIQNQTLHELVDPCLGFESDYAVRRMTTWVAELAFRCLPLESEMRPTMDEVLEILRGIENEEYYKVEKAEVVVIPSNDVGLLKSCSPPLSPDSNKWVSWSTTPSASV